MGGEKILQAPVAAQVHQGPVIQARPFQITVLQPETQGLHQVQDRPQGGAGPDDVARVLGNFRLVQDDVQFGFHENTVAAGDSFASIRAARGGPPRRDRRRPAGKRPGPETPAPPGTGPLRGRPPHRDRRGPAGNRLCPETPAPQGTGPARRRPSRREQARSGDARLTGTGTAPQGTGPARRIRRRGGAPYFTAARALA
ncbi:MAG: hypothetical protein BWY88_00892 [Synergistetes bacterium ADurb.Bin520]|nr:MAG: hypothetical protein BWY88_00892 [Synergistetes bacterium ADurb.Bin520]